MVIKRKKKHGHIYLEEYRSVRVDGKVKSIYIRSLGPEKPVAKTQRPKPMLLDRLEHGPSHRAGDVTILLELAHRLDFINIIDGICCGETDVEGPSPGKLLTVWAINRALDPASATRLERWVPSTDLPRLMGLSPADFTKDAFLSALDFVCYEDKDGGQIQDFTPRIDDAIYREWRGKHPLQSGANETLAYDLTSVLFYGVSCPLAELGYNRNRIRRRQVNLALVVSRRGKFPLTHFVYEGSRNGVSTIKNLMARLVESSLEPGTLIWDRGNVSGEHVKIVVKAGWHLICGVPKTVKDAREIISKAEIHYSWDSLARSSKAGNIYVKRIHGRLYGEERNVVVYTNRGRGVRDGDARNEALAAIEEGLKALGGDAPVGDRELRGRVRKIIGEYGRFVDFRVRRKDRPRVAWRFRKREIRDAERMDGKWVLLCTDPSLSGKDVVNTYLEKDFIEKVFRTLKTSEEIEPVRHRLECRVRAYLFVCVLAYMLLADLQHRLRMVSDRDDSWERADALLQRLGRVERVDVRLGQQVKTWYLNVTQEVQRTLKKMGFQNLLKETVEVDLKM